MSTDRETARIVRSWLRTDEHESADRVLGAVLDRLETTPQRRAWWPARRLFDMNQAMRIALASAAAVAVAVVGFSIWQGQNMGGLDLNGATPTPTPEPEPLPTGDLEAGTYTLNPFLPPHSGIRFTFTVPDGWVAASGGILPEAGSEGPDGAGFGPLRVAGLYSDPCHGNQGEPDIPVGPTVDDLVTALAAQPMYETTTPTDVVVDGYAGKQMDVILPTDVDFSSCTGGQYWVWDSPPYAQGPGNRWHLSILDVEGVTVVVLAQDFAETPPGIRDELQSIVDSVRIDTR